MYNTNHYCLNNLLLWQSAYAGCWQLGGEDNRGNSG